MVPETVNLFYEYYKDCFVNNFVNTLNQEMNTMNTFYVNNALFLIKKALMIVYSKTMHCIHQLIKSISFFIHQLLGKISISGRLNYE